MADVKTIIEYDITVDGARKEVVLEPAGIVEKNRLKEREDEAWQEDWNFDKLQTRKGRLGGGVFLILYDYFSSHERRFAFVQADAYAPRMPLGLDIAAGIADVSLLGTFPGSNAPLFPAILGLRDEANEFVHLNPLGDYAQSPWEYINSVNYTSDKQLKAFFKERCNEVIKKLQQASGSNLPPIVSETDNTSFDIHFSDQFSYDISERVETNKKFVKASGIIASERDEKSLEIIMPAERTIKNCPVIDGEFIHNTDKHLNRYIVLVHQKLDDDGEVRVDVYKSGKPVEFNGKPMLNVSFSEYINAPIQDPHPELGRKPISLMEAIRKGYKNTTGMRSKVQTLCDAAKKGMAVDIGQKKKINLEALAKIPDYLQK